MDGDAMGGMKWLLVALVVLAAVYGLLHLGSARKAGPRPLFPGFKAEAAHKITLGGPNGKAALEKRDDVWVVTSEASYPADADAVKEMLDVAVGLSRKDMISSNPEKQADYQVDTTGVAVTIEDAQGKTRAAFIIGRLGPDYQSTYVREANSASVILAPGYLTQVFSRGKQSWQDKRIFNYEPADLVELGVDKPGLAMVLKRGDDGKWLVAQPESAACDSNKASRLARILARLTSVDFAGRVPMPEAGVDRPDSSVWFKLANGTEAKLVIGHDAGGGRFYAAKAQGSVVYLVSAQTVKNLLADVASLAPAPEADKPAAPVPGQP
jgi:hypothetical protein